eukprot:363067-Chlamydomonas_euryale.AAC.11
MPAQTAAGLSGVERRPIGRPRWRLNGLEAGPAGCWPAGIRPAVHLAWLLASWHPTSRASGLAAGQLASHLPCIWPGTATFFPVQRRFSATSHFLFSLHIAFFMLPQFQPGPAPSCSLSSRPRPHKRAVHVLVKIQYSSRYWSR